jgi:predicted RND superfamily exporter protein
MGTQLKNAHFNSDLLTYLPDDMPSRTSQKKIEEIFGGTDMVMLVVKTDDVINEKSLERVKSFSRAMKKIKGIEKVMSLFELKQVRSEDDAMLVDPAVRMIPRTPEDIETVKKEIMENDMVYGSVVSRDFTSTTVIGMLEPGTSDKTVIGQLEKLIKNTPGAEEVLLGGSPYMRVQTSVSMQKDISRLLPLGMLLMLLFLLVSFRQIRGVWLPTVVVLISIFISLGLIPLLKWDFTVVTILLPVLLIAVANDYGIHMFAHYQDDNFPGNSFSKEDISRRMITSIGVPVILAGITTMAGLSCMMGHILIPAWRMGVLGTVGIGVALLASLFLIPAISSMLPKTKPFLTPANNEKGKRGMNRILTLISDLVIKRPRMVIVTLAAVMLILSMGIFRLTVNTNPTRLYPAGHPARVSADLINRDLGGFFPVSIVFEGDIKDPDLLKKSIE